MRSSAISDQAKGIACIIAAGAVISLSDVFSKVLTQKFPTGEILFFQSFCILAATFVGMRLRHGKIEVRVHDWPRQLARGVLFVVNSFVFVTALRYLPLADLVSILFLSPILVTLMAPFFLGEQVGWRRYAAVGVGFCGTLLIVDPTGDFADLWPMLLALVIPVLGSVRDIITRQLSRTDNADTIMVVTTACLLVVSACTLPFDWVTPNLEELAMLVAAGLSLGVAMYLQVYAFIFGEAAVVAPFRYFILIWATLYGYTVFGDIPTVQTLAGAGIVVASGLYIFFREARHKPPAVVPPTTPRIPS